MSLIPVIEAQEIFLGKQKVLIMIALQYIRICGVVRHSIPEQPNQKVTIRLLCSLLSVNFSIQLLFLFSGSLSLSKHSCLNYLGMHLNSHSENTAVQYALN